MKQIQFDLITTRGGDGGKTSLLNGERRSKNDIVFTVLGDIDEASSAIGFARSLLTAPQFEEICKYLVRVQRNLLMMGGEIASPPPGDPTVVFDAAEIPVLEETQATYMKGLKITGFIIPGCATHIAGLDMARTVVRRAERSLVTYIQERYAEQLTHCQIYLNRLSDFLFVLARFIANQELINEY